MSGGAVVLAATALLLVPLDPSAREVEEEHPAGLREAGAPLGKLYAHTCRRERAGWAECERMYQLEGESTFREAATYEPEAGAPSTPGYGIGTGGGRIAPGGTVTGYPDGETFHPEEQRQMNGGEIG